MKKKQGKLVYNEIGAKSPCDVCMLWGKYFEHLYTKKEEDGFDKELYWKISEKVSGLFTNKYKEHIDTSDKSITLDNIKDEVRTLVNHQDKITFLANTLYMVVKH